jgi:hypothetical protein
MDLSPEHKLDAATKGLRKGIYLTTYGNAAYVGGPKAKTAYDLDMGERIPITEVTADFIRKAEPSDSPSWKRLN